MFYTRYLIPNTNLHQEQEERPNRRQRSSSGRTLTETSSDEALLSNFYNVLEGKSFSDKKPLLEEFMKYISFIRVHYWDDDAIFFSCLWREHSDMFPILSRIAKRVMAASASSSDVERLFSRAGIIFFSPLRNNLKPETIQFLTTLHYWYIEEDGIEESNAARNVESAR